MPPRSSSASNYEDTSVLGSWFGPKSRDIFCTAPTMALLPSGTMNTGCTSSYNQPQQPQQQQQQQHTSKRSSSKQGQYQHQQQQQQENIFPQCYQFQGSMMIMNDCTPSDYDPSNLSLLTFAKKRRVSFVSPKENQTIIIPSYRDLSDEEYKAVYMSKDEMGKIHEECWRLVDLMNSGIEYEDQAGFSKRGLVDLKQDNVERRRRMRDQAYRIVFGIQKFHADSRRRTECMDITEVTANLYHKAAARSQEEAYESAWFDSIAARASY